MSEVACSRVWLDVDLGALVSNYRKIVAAVAPCEVVAVLKANAYGLGVSEVATALSGEGCRYFGVADLREALLLVRRPGIRVQVLGALLPAEIPEAAAAGVILPCGDLGTARLIREAGKRLGRPVPAHFLVDSGMGRLGVPVGEAEALIRQVFDWDEVQWEGLYSHFPVAYRTGSAYTLGQIAAVRKLLDNLAVDGIDFAWRHIANSDAVNNFAISYAAPFNAVRTGINLYGSFDPEGSRVLALDHVISLKTRLVAVRELAEGASIGYGCTYRLPKRMRVGTVPIGYADGVPMALSNRGHVLVRGVPCHVLGRVSMDYTTIALDTVPDAACGDEVVCLGGSGPAAITPEHWATLKGTHAYDILCSIGPRVERRYFRREA
ncbi:MAG: alanine racemase [Kiritimatiellia bacterium]